MADSVPQSPRVANVSDLQHTPVTLGVVLAVQAVALTSVLIVAGVLWGRITGLEAKIDSLQRDLTAIREDNREMKVLLRQLVK